jgi:hypothetical protein
MAILATEAGVRSLDLQNPGAPPLVTSATCPNAADVQVAPDGRTAYVAGREGVAVLDVTGPETPRLAATLPGAAVNLHVSADGETLFVAGEAGLTMVDVRPMAAPVASGVFDAPSADPMDVVVTADGDTAYLVTEGGGGLDVVRVAAPAAPELLSHHYVRHTNSVALSPDEATVYVADAYEVGLQIIDVRDPRAPVVQGALARPVVELALSPDASTMLATGPEGLLVVDLRAPEAPTVLGTIDLGQPLQDIAYVPDGRTAVLVDAEGGLSLVDVSRPAAPLRVAELDTPGRPGDVALLPDGHTALVTTGHPGPCVTSIDLGTRPTLEPAAAPEAGVRHYTLRWTDRYPEHPEQIAWQATAGEVAIEPVDQENHTAHVAWTLPADAGEEATLLVAVGNHQYFEVAREEMP